MPTRTWAVQKDARIAESGDLGAGASSYSPVGVYSGYKYRTLLDFAQDWSDMVTVTKAVIKLKVSSQYYVAFSSDPDIEVRRLAESWSEGTSSGLSGSNSVTWSNQPSTTGNTVTVDISTTEGTWVTIDVTSIMYAIGASVYGFQLRAATESSGGDVTEFYSRESSYDPYMEITYTTTPPNAAPTAPTGLVPSGGVLRSPTPGISFNHIDANGDALLKYDLQVGTDAAWATATHLNVANQTGAISGNAVSGSYGTTWVGTALTRGVTYYWRARTYSATGVLTASPWSANGSFKVNSLPVPLFVQPSATDALVEMVKVAGSGVAPRMVIRWDFTDGDTSDVQTAYQVVVQTDAGGAFYSGVKTLSGDTSLTVPVDPVRNTFYKVTVTVWDSSDEAGSTAQRRFKVNWTVAEYRTIDMGTVSAWSAVPTSNGGTNKLVVTEYGSSLTGTTPHATWYASLASAGVNHYFHWRVWLFAWSGATTPTFDRMALTYTSDAGVLPDGWTLTSQHFLDQSVRVYGTQSLRVDNNATTLRSYQVVKVEKNTRYILSGRVRTDGASGAKIGLATTAAGALLVSSLAPVGTQEFGRVFTADVTGKPVYWNSGDSETVYVICESNGAVGTKAWWDALKLESSTVVTPWTPGFVGSAVAIDVGGIQVDAEAGAVLRLKGQLGGLRDTVELSPHGLYFGGENPAEVSSPSASMLRVDSDLQVTAAAVAGVQLQRAGGVEIAATTPYIDFKTTWASDYNMRLIQPSAGSLEVRGGTLNLVSGALARFVPMIPYVYQINGATYTADDTAPQTTTFSTLPGSGVVAVVVYVICSASTANGGNAMQMIHYDGTGVNDIAGAVYAGAVAGFGAAGQFIVATGGAAGNSRSIKYWRSWGAGTVTWHLRLVGYWTTE